MALVLAIDSISAHSTSIPNGSTKATALFFCQSVDSHQFIKNVFASATLTSILPLEENCSLSASNSRALFESRSMNR
jgi:hypothetical protein